MKTARGGALSDEQRAEAAAVTEFRLDDEQHKRLVVRERD
jgi:hypothetical protein